MKLTIFLAVAVIALGVTGGYVYMAIYGMVQWNQFVSGTLVGGFISFAIELIRKFFLFATELLNLPPLNGGEPKP